ncbi:MAG TPA: hypothetical protein VFS54_05965 [Solirubrobacterales bacterium]|nr:hypothetical protein [Solirubrobacterales bacterium]
MKKRSVLVGLAVAAILLSVSGVASATSITSPTGTVATPSYEAESEGHLVIDAGGGLPKIECASKLAGSFESHGEGKPASTKLTTLDFTGCTNSWHVTTVAPGELSVEWINAYSGTVTSTGMTVETTRAGVTCRYQTNKTFIGTLTGGIPATIDLGGLIPFHSGSGTCGTAPVALTGSYKYTSPSSLFVDGPPFEGSGPGTFATSPTGTIATPTVKAESKTFVVDTSVLPKLECTVVIDSKIESHGVGRTASGVVGGLSFTPCSEGWHVTVALPGVLEIDQTSGYNGSVVWKGATIEATRFGIVCRYATTGASIGTFTGGTPATIDLEGTLTFHGGTGALCGEGARSLTGSFTINSPESLFVDEDPGTTITAPTGTVATPTIKAESEGHIGIDHPLATFQCQAAFEGTVASHKNQKAAKVPLTSVTTTGCTDSWHGTVTTAGELEIAWTSGYNGTVTWNGGTIEMTRLGTTCRYKTSSTHLGTITGGSPATIDLEGKLPFHSGSGLCGTEAYPLTGSYKITSPSALYVDKAV